MNRFLEWWYRNDAVIRRNPIAVPDFFVIVAPDSIVEIPWGKEQYPASVPISKVHAPLSVDSSAYDDGALPRVHLRRFTDTEIVYRVPRKVRRGLPSDAGYSPDWRRDDTTDRLKLAAFVVVTRTGYPV